MFMYKTFIIYIDTNLCIQIGMFYVELCNLKIILWFTFLHTKKNKTVE